MENRFFDIDNNVYLNGLYLLVLIQEDDNFYGLDEINLKLFLMKNPAIMLNVCGKLKVDISNIGYEEYQYVNLQADMSKYLLKIQVKGLMEVISFLYSKGLIEFDCKKCVLCATKKCIEMDLREVPEKIIMLARIINKIFDKATVTDIKKILFVEGDYLYG